jgi:hypothetical protein
LVPDISAISGPGQAYCTCFCSPAYQTRAMGCTFTGRFIFSFARCGRRYPDTLAPVCSATARGSTAAPPAAIAGFFQLHQHLIAGEIFNHVLIGPAEADGARVEKELACDRRSA